MVGGKSPGLMSMGTLPCDLSHDACDIPTPHPPEQTDASENITFLQFRLRTVKKIETFPGKHKIKVFLSFRVSFW